VEEPREELGKARYRARGDVIGKEAARTSGTTTYDFLAAKFSFHSMD
jgi:hypothetical protein